MFRRTVKNFARNI